MKTPDEIKAGLRHCVVENTCIGCAYGGKDVIDCTGRLMKDALAYIERLEAELQQLVKIADIWGGLCPICKHRDKDEKHENLCLANAGMCSECSENCPCKRCLEGGYEWDEGTVRA